MAPLMWRCASARWCGFWDANHLRYRVLLQQSALDRTESIIDGCESLAQFNAFQRKLEELNSAHKLWLDAKVRFHLNLIQGYIAWINQPLVLLQEIELPGEQPLHGETYDRAAQTLLLMQGIVLDAEFKGLVAELETLMVDSIYHLDLRRSRSSLMRDRFNNQQSARLIATLSGDNLLGSVRGRLMALAVGLVGAAKGRAMEPEEAQAVVDELVLAEEAVVKPGR